MKQKDLAEEYLRRKIKKEPFNSLTTDFNFAFSANNIEEAFNAGRESVVENIPRLLFKESQEGLIADNGIFEFIYNIYKSASVDEPRYEFATTYETQFLS